MNFAERIIRTFEHKSLDKIVWQPRFAYWFDHYARHATEENFDEYKQYMPKRYIGMESLEIYDDLNASIRYCGETLKLPLFNKRNKKDAEIRRRTKTLDDGSIYREIITPEGTVSQTSRNGYTHDHLVKKIEDLEVIKYIVSQEEYEFNQVGYELAKEVMYPDYGLPTSYYFRSPYMRCVLEFMGFEKTIIFLRRYEREMEDLFQFLEQWDLKQYENVICKSPLKWVNFGENIDQNLVPPHYFEKYLMEYYHSRCKLLDREGKYTFIHIDGSFKDLLPLIPELPHDGIEALTPPPQGDVTVKEMYDAIYDSGKIFIDILPATLFMDKFEEEKLRKKTEEILELLSPNLILGISDELCMGDGSRLKMVSEVVENFEPH